MVTTSADPAPTHITVQAMSLDQQLSLVLVGGGDGDMVTGTASGIAMQNTAPGVPGSTDTPLAVI